MAKKGLLNKKQVLAIPKLLKSRNIREVAELYKVSWNGIYYWIKQLRKRGFKVETLKQGSKPLLEKLESQKAKKSPKLQGKESN